MTEFPIQIETDTDGITLRQVGTKTYSIGNGERCDMVFISDDEFPAVFAAMKRHMHEIEEREGI